MVSNNVANHHRELESEPQRTLGRAGGGRSRTDRPFRKATCQRLYAIFSKR